ncbi:ComEC/Rec2 family competence protein [Pannonibacter phragmitetus]|uniref:ComEC/Rec2 family competence protein n=1 Tax=Pannonibacter phragmitetus TaxID=121719 RepID=UPI00067B5D95|nr:ComEC/Rec2 family competence protein [Pannonibacter phragmitetus]
MADAGLTGSATDDRAPPPRRPFSIPDWFYRHGERLWRKRPYTPDAGLLKPAAAVSRKAQRDLAPVLQAFAFCGGISVYFSLPREPNAWVLMALAVVSLGFALRAHWRGRLHAVALVLALTLAGAAAGAMRTVSIAAPVLKGPVSAEISGHVSGIAGAGASRQVTVDVAHWSRRGEPPARVRLVLRQAQKLAIGDAIKVRARLVPPSGPVRPGGYDFAFRAYYDRIGATGFVLGAPEMIGLPPPGLRLKALREIEAVRAGLVEGIRTALGEGDRAALAAALLVGDRSLISDETVEDLREAGLAHVLSISGLHMALFAGGVYAAALALLAAFPPVALRLPIHKIAACVALATATAYLLLSGASVPTQRSYLMIALVFLGLLTGRRGLSLRSLSLVALALLIIAPEDLYNPGFQMSFAAVLCLVAVYDDWSRRPATKMNAARRASLSPSRRILSSVVLWAGGLAVTSLVAGVATGVIGAYHFDRVSPYGLLGNLLAMPAVSFIVMPTGVLAFLLLPFGLADLPLAVMAWGIDLMLASASFTASLSDTDGVTGQMPALAAVMLTASVFLLLLANGRWRVLAAIPLGIGIVSLMLFRPPDIMVADRGALVAVRDASGDLRVTASKVGFAAETWLRGDGVPPMAFEARRLLPRDMACDPSGCVAEAYPLPSEDGASVAPLRVALSRSLEALEEDCRLADMVISNFTLPRSCAKALAIGGPERTEKGALALWLDVVEGRVVITHLQWARPIRTRPWHGAQ